jgi:hemoglobin
VSDRHDARRDIETRADCERLVRAFYGRALSDPIIGFIFTDIAHLDLEAHVPRIASFWETVLLGARSYRGGAFRAHAELNTRVRLRRGHFERWLWLWRQTVDELFCGKRAELAKAHAGRVAGAFEGRLRALEEASAQRARELSADPAGLADPEALRAAACGQAPAEQAAPPLALHYVAPG